MSMPGRPFLQIPGPTLVPERIVRVISQSIIDHRGPSFAALTGECLEGLKRVFQTERGHVLIFPGSGTGGWESAIVNTLSPGDRILACLNGAFATGLARMAQTHGMVCDRLEAPYGAGVSAAAVEARLRDDHTHEIKAVLMVHNETSSGVTSDVAAVRRAIDAAVHPALLIVDAVSSLASIDLRVDEWGVDVALAGAQKGLMLPPGLALLAVSERAIAASQTATCHRSYWDWAPVIERNQRGEFPYTPPTAMLFGLRESLAMLDEEGLPNVFARHARLAEACRRAVRGLELEMLCQDPALASNTVTAVVMPGGYDSDAYIAHANRTLSLSLGVGLGDVKGKVFRIGHLGSLNELELLGGLAGVEMTLHSFGVPIHLGAGLAAAQHYLLETAPAPGGLSAMVVGGEKV
jgi:alanine-glyoxylate transaminase/serine-glyoxylate transaminase/serine-pyruvate transaminase